jgi:apolipoprotein D and lipocalin family protein
MTKHLPSRTAAGALLALLFASLHVAPAQSVTAVPKLDADRFMTTWYEIERYPIKFQRHCVSDQMMLYALGDKPRTFLIVTSCMIGDGNSNSWNAKGKLDPSGGGKMKVSRIWPFKAQYWLLAAGPDYEWALLGSPDRKLLWVLARSKTLAPGVLTGIEAKAAAQGFDTAKLVKTPQRK